MFAALLPGVTVLPVAVLGLADRFAGLGRAVLALADTAHVTLVVRELRQIDYLYRDTYLTAPAPAEVAVLDKLREVLPAALTDLTVPLQVVSQSHR